MPSFLPFLVLFLCHSTLLSFHCYSGYVFVLQFVLVFLTIAKLSIFFYSGVFMLQSGHCKLARQMTLLMALCDYIGNCIKVLSFLLMYCIVCKFF